jgi:hypothetical protein
MKKAPAAGSPCLFGGSRSERGFAADVAWRRLARAVEMVGYAPLGAAGLRERIRAALTTLRLPPQTKSPARFPARAQFVSFNFTNSLICGIVSSNHGAGWMQLDPVECRRRARPGDLDKVSTVHI